MRSRNQKELKAHCSSDAVVAWGVQGSAALGPKRGEGPNRPEVLRRGEGPDRRGLALRVTGAHGHRPWGVQVCWRGSCGTVSEATLARSGVIGDSAHLGGHSQQSRMAAEQSRQQVKVT